MYYKTDLAVIGGGASGLVAAITAKRLSPSLSVTVIEGLSRVGKKLAATGNGRCNITNKNLSVLRFHGEDPAFTGNILNRFGYLEIEEFFASVGVDFVSEGDRVYPASLQASSVVDALRFECDRLGIDTVLDCKINSVKRGETFTLLSENDSFSARSVIIATGLFSGGEKIGSDGAMFRLLKDMGHASVKATPSLVQLKTETDLVRQLKGIKIDAKATLLRDGRPVATDLDEVLFCDYGLSGPAILQISRESAKDDRKYEVSLDLYPEKDTACLSEALSRRIELLKSRALDEFFTGSLNKRLGQVILKACGYRLSDPVASLGQKDAVRLASALKDLRFKVTSNTGFINSQVTAGGLSTADFDPSTLMSKKVKGLFAAGEILDVDGDCGGFNLSWAFASGVVAAKGAVAIL